MAIASTAELLESLHHLQLLGPGQLEQLRRYQQFNSASPREVAKQLLGCGWLTAFQVDLLFHGRGEELVLEPYVLLDQLGAGAMGQVYKARHRTLARLVALKVLRPELGGNHEVIQRFRREVRAVAKLQHPNIVQALDADQANGTHFLAMEFVAGTDLGQLVRPDEPMPVGQACEAIRQAAIGLDHAHRHGLVHRDIKPSNLLFVQGRGNLADVVKILDLGMARLRDGTTNAMLNREAESGGETPLTRTGNVIGTPDFMAPEQARNSHLVDGRADLYSLGCTLYALLTGQAPFPGGTAIEKLFRHQEDEPLPVEHHRPEVHPALGAVVRKLMAKLPADRYQTGGEAAAALAAVLPRHAGRASARPSKNVRTTVVEGAISSARRTLADRRRPKLPASAAPRAEAPKWRPVAEPGRVVVAKAPAPTVAPAPARRWPWWAAGAAVAASLLLGIAATFAVLVLRGVLAHP